MSKREIVGRPIDLLKLIDSNLSLERAALLNKGVHAFIEEQGAIDPIPGADALVGQYYVDAPKLAFETLTFAGEVIASASESSAFLKSVPAFTRWLGALYENVRRLDRCAGELCVFKSIARSDNERAPMKIEDIARNMPCGMFGSIDQECKFAKGIKCSVSAADLSAVLRRLTKKKLIAAEGDNQWLRV